MSHRILTFAKRDDSAARQAVLSLSEWLTKRDCEVIDASGTEETLLASDMKSVTGGVIFGGDGTFLTLVRRLEQKDVFPLMGVNLGTLGFITEFNKEEVYSVMERLLEGKLEEEERPLVQVELWRGNEKLVSGEVFNDAVISKDSLTSMISAEVSIGGKFLSRMRGDGYIVSTPTGSTGYSLSAGGPLLHPKVSAFTIRPICSHSLTARSIVIPQKMHLELVLGDFEGKAFLINDGQVTLELKTGDRMIVSLSDTQLRMIRPINRSWPDVLRAKLGMD